MIEGDDQTIKEALAQMVNEHWYGEDVIELLGLDPGMTVKALKLQLLFGGIMTEDNYSQFCDLYCDDRIIGSVMVHLVFRPDGTITNREKIVFNIERKHKGLFRIHLIGNPLDTAVGLDILRPGDTVTIAPGMIRMVLSPRVQS